ncbi:MAG: tetratricopeptide repeat protein [Treponema sp.]|jgi:tetratricopeptide (TPR) repeat protein|nr:tetratricopeptide repeat protein [Treponema sp.]
MTVHYIDEYETNDEKDSRQINTNVEKIQEGVDYYNNKEWKNALREFLSKDTSNFSYDEKMELAYYLGLCYTKLGKYEEALVFLEQVVTSGSDVLRIFQCRMTLAYIYVITNRVKMAEYELNRLQSSGFESPLIFNTLAYAAYIQKRFKSAVDFYEKALEIDTNNTTAMNSMGYILADTGMDHTRALRLCKRAVDLKPSCAAYLDSLGWAYYKNGDMQEAGKCLKKAHEIAPNEELIKKHYKVVTGEAL